MGLGKEKGSSRINRYERQVTAISFESLETLSAALEVPMAYLLADTPAMAEGILAMSQAEQSSLDDLIVAVQELTADPALVATLNASFKLSAAKRRTILKALEQSIRKAT